MGEWERDVTDYLENDDLGNGQAYSSAFFNTPLESKDTLYAELWALDKALFTYFNTLASNKSQGPFSAAPANPPSNIDSGQGYFGIFMVDSMSIIIP